MSKRIEYGGTVHTFPDNATPEQIRIQLQRWDASQAKPAEEPGWFENFSKGVGAAWDQLSPLEAARGLWDLVTQPGEVLKGMAQQHKNIYREGDISMQQGDLAGGIAAAVGQVPLLGPAMYQVYRDWDQGNQAEAVGSAVGIMGGLGLIPRTSERLGSRWVGVPGMDALPAPQRAGVDYLRNRGVPLPAHTMGGGELPHLAGAAGAVSPAGAVLAPRMARRTEAGLSQLAATMERETLPQGYTPFTAGESLETALRQRAERQGRNAGRRYEVIEQAQRDPANVQSVQQAVDAQGNPVMADVPLPVDTLPFRAGAQELWQRMRGLTSSARRHTSDSYAALEGMLQGPRHIDLLTAEEILGAMKADLRTAKGRDRARLSQLIGQLEPVIDDTLRAVDPQLERALQQGRRWTRQQKDTERVYRQATGAAGLDPTDEARLREPEPVNIYSRMTQEGDRRQRLLGRIQRMTPRELPKMGRAYIGDILQRWRDTGEVLPTPEVAAAMERDWMALGEETKRRMFPLQPVRENWDHFFRGMRQVARNPNPSGTAKMGFGIGQLYKAGEQAFEGNWLAAAMAGLGPSALATLMFTDRGARLMRTGARIPAGDIAARAAWANQLAGMVEEQSRRGGAGRAPAR